MFLLNHSKILESVVNDLVFLMWTSVGWGHIWIDTAAVICNCQRQNTRADEDMYTFIRKLPGSVPLTAKISL